MPVDTMRERFVTVASDLLDVEPRLAIVLADIGTAQFRENGALTRHPDRVVNVGIREQLLVSFAAGMALAGFRPIVHTYAPFLVERPFEQLKLDFGHQGVGGIFVSVGASYDAAAAGRTHQAPEDVALLATLPGWRIHAPGHPDEVESFLRSEAVGSSRAYIRLAEDANAAANAADGNLAVVRRGSASASTVIAVGPTLDRVLEAVAELDMTVLYASTVRPFDGETLRSVLGAPEVILVEPYLAGTSSAEISGALRDTPHRLLALGVQRGEHRHYGTGAEHDSAHRLDPAGIRTSIGEFLRQPVPA